jgi:two-component system, LytTR family, sensor histidine kinase AlgZ
VLIDNASTIKKSRGIVSAAPMEHRRGDTRTRTANQKQILARKESQARATVFPELRNTGIMARALIIYVAMLIAYTIATTTEPRELLITFTISLAQSLPVAATIGFVWITANIALRRLAYWQAATLLGMVTTVAAVITSTLNGGVTWRAIALSLIALTAVLLYFQTLGRALSPAITEARLQALQARIRPHFLFNAINGVLGVLRYEPKRAEHALEDLAELFRALMKDTKDLRPLHDEVVLTRQYLDLEKLRLGDRLHVEWRLDKMPADALVPSLILQPIAENAVYHGIEPSRAAGTIEIEATKLRAEVIITVRNPFVEAAGTHHGGNKMAMSNIRERLALHFDAEARLVAGPRDGRWQVQITLPYRAAGTTRDTQSVI